MTAPAVSQGCEDFISLLKKMSAIRVLGFFFKQLRQSKNRLAAVAESLEHVSRQAPSGLCGGGRRSRSRLSGPYPATSLSVRNDMCKWHVPPDLK